MPPQGSGSGQNQNAQAPAVIAALGWAWTVRRPDGPCLAQAAAATAAVLCAGAIVREALRLALIERSRATALDSGGRLVFLVTLAVGIMAIAWLQARRLVFAC